MNNPDEANIPFVTMNVDSSLECLQHCMADVTPKTLFQPSFTGKEEIVIETYSPKMMSLNQEKSRSFQSEAKH